MAVEEEFIAGRYRPLKVMNLLVACLAIALPAHANLTFNFLPEAGTPQQVIDGFVSAGNRWSTVLYDDITVNVTIGFASLPNGVIGQTMGNYVERDYTDVRAALLSGAVSADDHSAYSHLQPGTTYSRLINHTVDNPNGANSATAYTHSLTPVSLTSANAKVLNLVPSGPDSDGSIRFNSSVVFDFDPSNGTTSGQYDFLTMASHELGHILGFGSAVDVLEQLAGAALADDVPSTVWDLFRFSTSSRAIGDGVGDIAADTRQKFFSLNGGTSSTAGLATGAVFGGGYQASHWREFTFLGLMDPTLFTGLQRNISMTDMRAFDVIGYRIPEPGTGTMLGLCLLSFATRRGIGFTSRK